MTVNTPAIIAALGLVSAVLATVAYVRYRQRESSSLLRNVELARGLRELADGDPVRLASVDEFEVGLYQRLFYVSSVGPRARSAAWALLATLLSATAVLFFDSLDGSAADVFWIVSAILTFCFGVAVIVYTALALYGAATTPRVSFADSYSSDGDEVDEY
ncbi:hypothetical protein GCM10023217_08120 [Gordonia alkaliphila]|uniref:DUF2721 domain-containing protein n=1 Tax=Gordonia alkaliphila TaxID=1053547 RepID=A0ABP8YYM8_9ACTN